MAATTLRRSLFWVDGVMSKVDSIAFGNVGVASKISRLASWVVCVASLVVRTSWVDGATFVAFCVGKVMSVTFGDAFASQIAFKVAAWVIRTSWIASKVATRQLSTAGKVHARSWKTFASKQSNHFNPC